MIIHQPKLCCACRSDLARQVRNAAGRRYLGVYCRHRSTLAVVTMHEGRPVMSTFHAPMTEVEAATTAAAMLTDMPFEEMVALRDQLLGAGYATNPPQE